MYITWKLCYLFISERDAERIYEDAGDLKLTGLDYVWIVTEQAMKPSNTPIGLFWLLIYP